MRVKNRIEMLLFTDDMILQKKKKTTDRWLEIKEESSEVAGYKNSTSMSTKVLHINGKQLEDTIKETISYISLSLTWFVRTELLVPGHHCSCIGSF